MATPEPPAAWEDRILGYEPNVDPTQLLAHELNARRHPGDQRDALRESLGNVGWVAPIIVNKRTGKVVDGHARVEEAITRGATVPVMFVELSDEEEHFVLATLDPISALATYDETALGQLLDHVDVQTDALADWLESVDTLNADDLDRLGDGNPDRPAESGDELAALADVTINYDPAFKVERGDVWDVGQHVLVCADVLTEHTAWGGFLDSCDLFVPYPGVYIPFAERAATHRLLMVQPDPFLASHLVDKYVQVKGADDVAKRA